MLRLNKKLALIITLFYPGLSFSFDHKNNDFVEFKGQVPEGFEKYLEKKNKLVTLKLYSRELRVPADFIFKKVRFDDKDSDELEAFLYLNGLDFELSNKIKNQLLEGIVSSSLCKGLISQCTLEPETFDFVFDESNLVLTIFVNEKYISNKNHKKYFTPNIENIFSAVNYSNLYFQGLGGNETLQWKNDTLVSLPLGYLDTSSMISNDKDQGIEFYNYNYVLDKSGYSLELGYNDRFSINNSVASLFNGRHGGTYSLSIFNNDRLAKRVDNQLESMSVFVQESTELEIYRDDKLIYRTQLNQGFNDIPYSTFERGSYNVKLVYKVAGRIEKEENRTIFNVPYFNMKIGDHDWYAKLGYLESSRQHSNSLPLLELGMTYRPFSNLLIGGGYDNVGSDSYVSLMSELLINANQRFSYNMSSDFEDNHYSKFTWNYNSIYVSAERLKADDISFSSLYGTDDRRQISVTMPFEFFGYHSVNYNYYNLSNDLFEDIDSDSLSINSTYDFDYFNLSSTIQYDKTRNDKNENLFFGLNISVPLGKDIDIYSSVGINDDSEYSMRNSILSKHLIEKNIIIDSEVSVESGYLSENIFSGQLGLNYDNRYFSSQTRGYIDSNNNKNISFNLNGSQLINNDGVIFTEEVSDSYIIVRNKTLNHDIESNVANYGDLELTNESNSSFSVSRLDFEQSVVPVNKYSQYSVNLRSNNSKFTTLDSEQNRYFAKPGTLLFIDNNLVKVNQYLVSFINEDGRQIEQLDCVGDGCYEVEEVTEGVFKVSTYSGYDFELFSKNRYCLISQLEDVNHLSVLEKSLCMEIEEMEKLLEDNSELYYVGIKDQHEIYDEDQVKFSFLDKVALFEKQKENDLMRKLDLSKYKNNKETTTASQ